MKKLCLGVSFVIGLFTVLSAGAYVSFGPTAKGDTLWKIAGKYPLSGVSQSTMVKAIYALNQQGFSGSSQHALKVGVKLTIPSAVDEVKIALANIAAHQNQSAVVGDNGSTNAAASLQHEHQTVDDLQRVVQKLHAQLRAETQALTKSNNEIALLQKQKDTAVSNTESDQHIIWGWVLFVVWLLTLGYFLLYRRRDNINKYVAKVKSNWRQRWQKLVAEFKESKEKNVKKPTKSKPKPKSKSVGKQAELGIAKAATHSEPKQPESVPIFDQDELLEQDKQRQALLDAIEQAPDKFKRHQALLDFFVENDEQDAFDAHLKYMVAQQVVQEGDDEWNRLRSVYLNQWVYDN